MATFAVATAVGLAGCAGAPPSGELSVGERTCAAGPPVSDGCPPAGGPVGLARISNCFMITHTIDTPGVVFQPDYPSGTRAAQDGVTIASLTTLLCEQASTLEATVAPFHFAYFASVIDPPGPSADGSSETLAAHQFLTNAGSLGVAAAPFGLAVGVVTDFSFQQSPAPGTYASPYRLRVPSDRPVYAFEGTSNAGGGSLPDHKSDYLYLAAEDGRIALVKVSLDAVLANPSQPAASMFGAGSYWAEKSDITTYPSVNYQRRQASGNLTIEFPERL